MQIKDLQIETRCQMSRPALRLDFASREQSQLSEFSNARLHERRVAKMEEVS